MTALAIGAGSVLAGLAAALLIPPGSATDTLRRRGFHRWRSLLAAVAVALVVWAQAQALALALIGGGGVLGAARAVARARAARAAAVQEARVVEVCEALAGELRAGQPPRRALEHCAASFPELTPVAGAARLDADVPAALRRLARTPGARGLGDLAAGWQVSAGSGAGLATALTRIADSARHEHSGRALVASELASARATVWLVAALPLLSLTLGAGLGGDPWSFLLGTGAGLGCLAGGVLLVLAGVWWVDRIAAQVQGR